MTSLSLQEVDYYEPSNFYIGPRAVRFYSFLFYSPQFHPEFLIDLIFLNFPRRI